MEQIINTPGVFPIQNDVHVYTIIIAERLSARQLILHRISKMCICLSVCVSVHYILCACARGLRPTTC